MGWAVTLCPSLQTTLLRHEAWSGLTEVTRITTSGRSAYVLLTMRHGLYYETVTDAESFWNHTDQPTPHISLQLSSVATCLTLVRSRECIIKIESRYVGVNTRSTQGTQTSDHWKQKTRSHSKTRTWLAPCPLPIAQLVAGQRHVLNACFPKEWEMRGKKGWGSMKKGQEWSRKGKEEKNSSGKQTSSQNHSTTRSFHGLGHPTISKYAPGIKGDANNKDDQTCF